MVEAWKYGDAGDRIPVEMGDIWQVGPHVLACGNVEMGDHRRLVERDLGLRAPHMVYVDPPWTQGHINAFFTKAGMSRDGGTYLSFLERLLSGIAVFGDIYMEGGLRERPLVEEAVFRVNLHMVERWHIVYSRHKPCVLYHLHHAPQDAAINGDCTGMNDEDTPYWGIQRSSAEGDTVFDPCLGRGGTAIAAHRMRRKCLGLELHPRRLAVAIDKLARMGLDYRKVGTL